jgi:hypothetical protein
MGLSRLRQATGAFIREGDSHHTLVVGISPNFNESLLRQPLHQACCIALGTQQQLGQFADLDAFICALSQAAQ